MEIGCKNTTLFYTRDINRCVFPVFNTCWDFFATWSGVFTCLLAKKTLSQPSIGTMSFDYLLAYRSSSRPLLATKSIGLPPICRHSAHKKTAPVQVPQYRKFYTQAYAFLLFGDSIALPVFLLVVLDVLCRF